MFSTLTDEDLNTLETLFTTITLDDNQLLCKEGSRVDHVYVVKRGFLRVLKAFLPEDGKCPRPPSRASSKASPRATSRGSSTRASSRPNIVNNGTELAEGGLRLMYFDLGEIGPKAILGENGVLQQLERMPSTLVTSSPASNLPMMSSNQEPEDEYPEKQPNDTSLDTNDPTGDTRGGGDALLPSDTNANAAANDGTTSSAMSVRPKKEAYLVSATASRGKAEVYVAKAHELKIIQTESFRYSWKTAERLHQARAQAWNASALAQQLRRQQEWESLKRTVLSKLEWRIKQKM